MSVFEEMAKSIVTLDDKKALNLASRVIKEHKEISEAIDKGFAAGMEQAGKLWEEGDFFLPQLMKAAEIMQKVMELFRPEIIKKGESVPGIGKVVIGTVEGDIHDIGKTLVAVMLEAAGFEVFDLGRDVPLDRFIQTAHEKNAHIIGLSALLTTTMMGQRRLIDLLVKKGDRSRFKVLIGGSPVTMEWCKEIGADGYASNALQAVEVAKQLVKKQ